MADPEQDPLHKLLRHTIRACYGDDDMAIRFKGLAFDEAWGMSKQDVAGAVWPCWTSADRLCLILTGDEMRKPTGERNPLADQTVRDRELGQMKLKAGYVLVRVDVTADGAGHAYIFLSSSRPSGNNDVSGFIYQTNIGCDDSFDLLAWIDDQRSKQEVEFGAYSQSVLSGFRDNPVAAYQEKYMLSTGAVRDGQAAKLRKNPAVFGFVWKPVNEHYARIKLSAFVKAKVHPKVGVPTQVRLTGR